MFGPRDPGHSVHARQPFAPQVAQVGIQPYGVPPVARRSPGLSDVAAYRAIALGEAGKIYAATGRALLGFRDSPWGSEVTAFGTRSGLDRWMGEQAADEDVWYAAAFDLTHARTPFTELSR